MDTCLFSLIYLVELEYLQVDDVEECCEDDKGMGAWAVADQAEVFEM